MKKIIGVVLTAVLFASVFAGCTSQDSDSNRLVIGATPVPHAEILEFVREELLERGVELEIREFTDFSLVNPALYQGQIDANYFQHIPFLENWVNASGNVIVNVAQIHIEPMGIYSTTISSLDELPENGTVAIPNDVTNYARALTLMQSFGLITLSDDAGFFATRYHIVDNPLNLQITPLDAAMVPRTLGETDISIINTNHVLAATDLNPMRDSLAIEPPDSPYANVIAVREEDVDNENIRILIEVLQSERVRDFILERYDGAVVPVF